jgi:hypothetical protein
MQFGMTVLKKFEKELVKLGHLLPYFNVENYKKGMIAC